MSEIFGGFDIDGFGPLGIFIALVWEPIRCTCSQRVSLARSGPDFASARAEKNLQCTTTSGLDACSVSWASTLSFWDRR